MFCPSCSSPSPEGAKFCKSCGLNLTVVTQAIGGGVSAVDPIREREYRRARKKISDGIHGSAFGAALLVAAAVGYLFLPKEKVYLAGAIVVALLGVIKFFLSMGHIIDAKVGPKLLGPSLQARGTGSLPGSTAGSSGSIVSTPSRRLPAELSKATSQQQEPPRLTGPERKPPLPPYAPGAQGGPTRAVTGRVNREQSSPLRKSDKEDDLMSKLRN